MAKAKKSQVLRLVSQAGTGYFYTIRRAIKANMEKYAARTPALRAPELTTSGLTRAGYS